MSLKQDVFILFLLLFKLSEARYFTVIGPRTLQHGQDYPVVISTTDSINNLDLKLFNSKNQQVQHDNEFNKINITGASDKTITFQTKNDAVENYTLTVTQGSFQQTVMIYTIAKKYSVFIQTDKGIYKPKDKVRYRILVLDSEQRPYKYEFLRLNITDANSKLVHRHDDLETEKHDLLFEGNLDLTEDPNLGEWKISVQIEGDSHVTERSFKVEEYVLPRFEVFINTNQYVSVKDTYIYMKVYAKYTFGEYVKGTATVTASVIDPSDPNKFKRSKSYELNNIQSEKDFFINMAQDLNLYAAVDDILIKIEVTFREDLTGQTMTASKTVTVQLHKKFRIAVKHRKKLRPGLPFELKVDVKQPDGFIDLTLGGSVDLKIKYYLTTSKCTVESLTGNEISLHQVREIKNLKLGSTEFVLDVPNNATSMEIKITYRETSKNLNFYAIDSATREYIQAKVNTIKSSLIVDGTVNIDVKSSSELKSISYLVVGRTGVIMSKTDNLENMVDFEINFKVTNFMFPKAHVLVYYIHDTGEVIYDFVAVNFLSKLPNKLEITTTTRSPFRNQASRNRKNKRNSMIKPETYKPREKVFFNITSNPNSTVYLLAVGHSVNLLQIENNIDEKTIFEEMMAYNKYKTYEKLSLSGNYTKKKRYIDVGEANTFIITNAYGGNITCPNEKSNIRQTRNAGTKYVLDDSQLEDYESKSRDDSPEVWLFTKVDVDSDGNVMFENELPDSITSWDISAFALSEKYGLGFAKPKTITVLQERKKKF